MKDRGKSRSKTKDYDSVTDFITCVFCDVYGQGSDRRTGFVAESRSATYQMEYSD